MIPNIDEEIIKVLENQSPLKTREIFERVPFRESTVRNHLKKLCVQKKIKKVSCKRVDLRYIYYALVK